MYVPAFTAIDEPAARAIVDEVGSGWLVTATGDGAPEATLLPLLWHGDRVVAHMARANPHWRAITDGMAALFIVTGAEAYVSPAWYASKAEHGRVVPTWNYTAVHLAGTVRVHDDPAWVRRAVTDLTDRHEVRRAEVERSEPWRVDDAPTGFLDGQLRAIVGVELRVTRVEGKAKLSQNRSDADRAGVVAGLHTDATRRGNAAVAVAMAAPRHPDAPDAG